MAQSFWSKRKESISTAGSYIQSTDAVSRPTAILMTLAGILLVGGTLFGIFMGTRWAFSKLSDRGTVVTTQTSKPNDNKSAPQPSDTTTSTPSPSVTVTSSTSTTTPSTAVASTTSKLPQTGPNANFAVFFAIVAISYLTYRKKLLRS